AAKAIAAQAPVPTAVIEDEADEVADIVDEEIGEAETAREAEQPQEQPAEGEAREDDSQHRGRRRRPARGREGREGGREPREGGFAHETVADQAIAHEGDDEAAPPDALAGSEGEATHRPGVE